MLAAVDDVHTSSTFKGIYEIPDVARYLKVALDYGCDVNPSISSTIRLGIQKGVVSSRNVKARGRKITLNFEDVISMQVIMTCRANGVSWKDILITEDWIRKNKGFNRPFASDYFWTGQRELYVGLPRHLLSGSKGGQMALFRILERYLEPVRHRLSFNETTHRATSWEPFDGVLLEPEIQYGSPCIKGTRMPTRTIFEMIETGDTVSDVAEEYILLEKEVEAAREWEERLRQQ